MQITPPQPIKCLDAATADQIAAGEVVERPGAALKELLENSLDAGATEITVRLQNGGEELIEVIDNGSGIPESDLHLAFERHATSKISSIADLVEIRSMGFRGEALAAISAVSRTKVRSTSESLGIARELIYEGSSIVDDRELPRERGTTVRVENLFYNTPARKQFLGSRASETNYCLQVFHRLALAHPHCSFHLTVDNQPRFAFAKTATRGERVSQVFRDGLNVSFRSDELLEFRREKPEIAIEGYMLPMRLCRNSARGIFTFVNNRAVKDKLMLQAVMAAAREVLFGRQFPQLALFLEIDPKQVDVNVHPTKAELRFKEPSPFGFIRVAVRESLATLRLPTATDPRPEDSETIQADPTVMEADLSPSIADPEFVSAPNLPLSLGRQFRAKVDPTQAGENASTGDIPRFLGAIHNTYLVCEDELGLLLVDQHAAHERVTYERLRQGVLGKQVDSAPLLIPIVVELSPESADLIEQEQEGFQKLGLYLERFGPQQIKVVELPTLLLNKEGAPRVALHEFVQLLAEKLVHGVSPEESTEILERKLLDAVASMSCHGSVRAGQALSPSESRALLLEMQATDFAAHCPHGRPTSVRLSWTDLEKLFKRIV